jgi:polysaccharide biosynthesis protein PslJ
MTTARPATTAWSQNGAPSRFPEPQARERTPWLLAFLCLLFPIMPAYSVPPGPLKSNGSPARVIIIILFVLAVLGFVLIRRTASTRTVRPGVVLILVYFLIMLAVGGVGLTHVDSALAEAGKTRAIIYVVGNVGLALYALTRVVTLRQRSILLGCLAIGLTFNCAAGLLQNSTHIDLHLLFHPPGFVLNTADRGGVGAWRATTDSPAERFGARRAFGTSDHPIEFSVLTAVTVPLTIHFARYAANRQVRLLAALAAVVALLAVPAGVSRSGVVALAAAFLVYMRTFTLRQLGVAVVAGAAGLFVQFAAAPANAHALWETITKSAKDSSVTDRFADFVKVSRTFHDHPVFGLGLGASPPQEYGFLDNEWLQAIVQGGAVGVVAMIVLTSSGIFGVAAALRGATTPRERDQAYMMGAMLIGIIASSFTFDLFSYQHTTLLFFMLFGLLWSNFTIASPDATTTRPVADRASFG